MSLEPTFDTLSVGTGNDSSVDESQLQKYSGHLTSEQIIFPWSPNSSLSLWVKFETDYTVRDIGFIIIVVSGT